MKKLLFALAIAAVLPSALCAQSEFKPTGDSVRVAAELFLTPASFSVDYDDIEGTPSFSNTSISIPSYGAKVRVFKNQWAFRMQLGLNSTIAGSSMETSSAPGSSATESHSSESYTSFALVPGFEYHFKGSKRVSPYVGAEVGLLLNSNGRNSRTAGELTDSYSNTRTGFVFNALTGFDVYVCKGLYLGAELGFGVKSMCVEKDVEETYESRSVLTNIGFVATPAIRVGWLF